MNWMLWLLEGLAVAWFQRELGIVGVWVWILWTGYLLALLGELSWKGEVRGFITRGPQQSITLRCPMTAVEDEEVRT